MCEGSAGTTSDPHVWPLSTARHVKCISVAYMGACQYRHTKCRGMSSTALCRYMSYTVMYMDICMQGTRLGPYMPHIRARLDLPHFTYTTPGDVCYPKPTRSGQVTLRNGYHDGNFTYNFRFLFQDRSV